jgi:hypothetical protein
MPSLATTPFVGGHLQLSVPLPPSSLGNPNAPRAILQGILMRYHSVLGGFLVAFSNARYSASGDYGTQSGAPLGRIVAEQPVIHARLESEVLLFRPQLGQVLEGCVNRVSAHSLSCLVAGLFNATIMLDEVAGGYYYSDAGSGSFKSTEVWARAREVEEAGGGEEGSAPSMGRSRRKPGDAGRNELLAANPDTIEVGDTVVFRVKTLLHSRGVLQLRGTMEYTAPATIGVVVREERARPTPSAPIGGGKRRRESNVSSGGKGEK